MSGPVIENGTVVIDGGRITAVGATVPLPVGARVVDAKGKWVTPGLINALTVARAERGRRRARVGRHVGAGRGRRRRRAARVGRPEPGLGAVDAGAQRRHHLGGRGAVGGLVAGQAAFLDTDGDTRAALLRRAPVAMAASLTASTAGAKSRGDLLLRLRQLLDDARTYGTKKVAFERAATRPFVVSRLHLEALQPVLAGKLPLLVAVDRASDIQALLDLAREYRVRVIVQGGAEAWRVAPALAAAKVPVLVSALDNIPSSFDALGSRQENAALLRRAGVPVVITAGAVESFNVRNVKQHAGNAVAYGLPWDEALRAVTLAAAEAFGVADTVGSLAVGKAANVVVWSGDPFEFSTRVEHVYVRGVERVERSRQDLLMERYKTPGRD